MNNMDAMGFVWGIWSVPDGLLPYVLRLRGDYFVLSQSPRWGPVATEGGCYWDIAKAVFYCHPKEVLIRKLIGQILL